MATEVNEGSGGPKKLNKKHNEFKKDPVNSKNGDDDFLYCLKLLKHATLACPLCI